MASEHPSYMHIYEFVFVRSNIIVGIPTPLDYHPSIHVSRIGLHVILPVRLRPQAAKIDNESIYTLVSYTVITPMTCLCRFPLRHHRVSRCGISLDLIVIQRARTPLRPTPAGTPSCSFCLDADMIFPPCLDSPFCLALPNQVMTHHPS